MRRFLLISLLVFGLAGGQAAASEWTQWRVSDGGNGHWYRVTAPELTWSEAEAEAVSHGGHLVTVNDVDENDWLLSTYGPDYLDWWIGFYQDLSDDDYSEPDHGWKWVSDPDLCRWVTPYPDDDPCYTNWDPGEPNNGSPTEECVEMRGINPLEPDGSWNDAPCDGWTIVGIIERETQPPEVPAVSEWGLLVMALLGLAAGTVMFRQARRRGVAT
jgi:hypothetical protein